MIVANKLNLKKSARQLLGVNYTLQREKMLLQCTNLNEFDNILCGYGIEGSYCHAKPELSFKYVNLGDGYTTTIIEYKGRLFIGCWSSIIEKRMNYL